MADLTNAEMKFVYRKIRKIWFGDGPSTATSSQVRDAANSISNWVDLPATKSSYNSSLDSVFKAAVTVDQKSDGLRAVLGAKYPG